MTGDAEPVPPFRNILFATDFSGESRAALPYALALARRYDAKLFLAHVIVPEEETLRDGEEARRAAQLLMEEIEKEAQGANVPTQTLLACGSIHVRLCELVRQHQVDLIVTGTHGRTGWKRLVLGSTAEEIFRCAPCPALTVGPKAITRAHLPDVQHILCATDFSPESSHAARYAHALARAYDARITMLHVLPGLLASNPEAEKLAHIFVEEMRRQLPGVIPGKTYLECRLAFGEPSEEIFRMREASQADLVVLGARRAGRYATHLLGGVAYRVVARAECPVLIVPS
ncbi:MAG TPA: universal stress protein [Terriglobales bacterium]|nr:universal stress protein [Terriglobales bacterium]